MEAQQLTMHLHVCSPGQSPSQSVLVNCLIGTTALWCPNVSQYRMLDICIYMYGHPRVARSHRRFCSLRAFIRSMYAAHISGGHTHYIHIIYAKAKIMCMASHWVQSVASMSRGHR